jgi:GNAT superfamily N-acetyltransferase
VPCPIRPARPADAVLLPAIERSAGEAFRAIPGLEWLADDGDQPVETHLALIAAGTSWVATDGADRPVGFVNGVVAGLELHILVLAVQRDRQRAGCGRSLVAAAIAWASLRLDAVTLTTFRHVPFNAPFYEGLGFRILADDELGPRLAGILRAEAERGLSAGRCAMRLAFR